MESETIRISEVDNGYVVVVGDKPGVASPDDTRVFQSFEELVGFLSRHFSYRRHSRLITDSEDFPIF